jgi:hypothetical protein
LDLGSRHFHAFWFGQSGYMTLCPGDVRTATVAYYNSGSLGWVAGKLGEAAYLGTSGPEPGQDRASQLGGDGTAGSPNTGWPRYNRLAAQPSAYVGPGQVAWFQFAVKAPSTPGTYRIALRPLVEGGQWMEDFGVFWVVNVPDAITGLVPTPPPTARPTAAPTVAAALGTYLGVGQTNWVSKNIDRGRFLLLGDRSLWEVARFDRFDSRSWLALTDVVVVSSRTGIAPFVYSIVEIPSFGSGASVGARYLKVSPLSISSISRDNSIVRLTDGSVWQIDSFDTFNTILWSSFQTIYVVDDREGISGYRLVNPDDRSSAGAKYLGR